MFEFLEAFFSDVFSLAVEDGSLEEVSYIEQRAGDSSLAVSPCPHIFPLPISHSVLPPTPPPLLIERHADLSAVRQGQADGLSPRAIPLLLVVPLVVVLVVDVKEQVRNRLHFDVHMQHEWHTLWFGSWWWWW